MGQSIFQSEEVFHEYFTFNNKLYHIFLEDRNGGCDFEGPEVMNVRPPYDASCYGRHP